MHTHTSLYLDGVHKREEIAFMHNNKIVSLLCHLPSYTNSIFFTAVGGSQTFHVCVCLFFLLLLSIWLFSGSCFSSCSVCSVFSLVRFVAGVQ